MGANGAGKSTLVKILTGAVTPDSGRIVVRGRERTSHSPAEARRNGLVSVYQEPALIPDLDIRANLRLTETPVEPFRHWLNELGLPDLDLSSLRAAPAAGLAARSSTSPARWPSSPTCCCSTRSPRRCRRTSPSACSRSSARSAARPLGHLHLAPHDRDRRGLRSGHRPARRRDRRRGRRHARVRGPDRRADARRERRRHARTSVGGRSRHRGAIRDAAHHAPAG